MTEWFAASDLAGMGLPGVPSTRRGVLKTAQRLQWQSRPRTASGGGREYHISSLPDTARAAILLRQRAAHPVKPAASAMASVDAVELWAAFERKSTHEKAVAQGRVEALMTVDRLVREGCQQLEAVAIVAHQLQESESTIRNWRRRVKGHDRSVWAPLLLRNYVGGGKRADYDPRIYQMFRDSYCDLSRPPAATCYYRVARWAESEGLQMPSVATLRRELERREDPHVILLEREGERELASAFPYIERDRSHFHAMQALNADGHNLDLAVEWEDKEKERATLVTVQDLASGAVIGWRVVKSESAFGLSLAFLDTFDRLGIPETLYVDNTLAAASKRLTSGAKHRYRFKNKTDDPIGVLPALGIDVRFTTTAHGQSKPIERSFKTLADQISKHPAFSGAYLGNSTVTKPANYGQRTVTVAEVEKVVRDEIAVFNAQLGRRGGVANGRSYWQVFDTSYREHADRIRRIAPTQRRLLYLVSQAVMVDRRDGCVKLFGNRYWSEEVARFKGTKVVLRYHPTESLHEHVLVYRLDGTFLAQTPIYNKGGFDSAAAAESHNRARNQFKRAKKDLAKAARRMKASDVAAMAPIPVLPDEINVATRRIDFALPTTVEQLGITRARVAATKKSRAAVEAAVGKFAEHIEPKRRKHA